MKNVAQETEKTIAEAIKVDKKEVMDHLDGLVRRSGEDTINELLNSEADAILQCFEVNWCHSTELAFITTGTIQQNLLYIN